MAGDGFVGTWNIQHYRDGREFQMKLGMARARDGCTGTWNRQHYRHAREVNKWQEVTGKDCAGNGNRQHYRDGREVQIWQDEVVGDDCVMCMYLEGRSRWQGLVVPSLPYGSS